MKKLFKYAERIFITVIMFAGLISSPVFATDLPDFNATGSVSITLESSEGARPADGVLTAYKVGNLTLDNGNMVYKKTEEFSEFEGDLDEYTSELAEKLAEFVSKNSAEGISANVSENGIVEFHELSVGLYLITQTVDSSDFYQMSPFLVGLPVEENGTWVYDIDATPKTEALTENPQIITEPGPVVTEPDEKTADETPEVITTTVTDIAGEGPKTGDELNLTGLWIMLGAVALGGIYAYRRHRLSKGGTLK